MNLRDVKAALLKLPSAPEGRSPSDLIELIDCEMRDLGPLLRTGWLRKLRRGRYVVPSTEHEADEAEAAANAVELTLVVRTTFRIRPDELPEDDTPVTVAAFLTDMLESEAASLTGASYPGVVLLETKAGSMIPRWVK